MGDKGDEGKKKEEMEVEKRRGKKGLVVERKKKGRK